MENVPKWNRVKNGIIRSEIINRLMFLAYQSLIRKSTRTEFFDGIFYRFNLNGRSGKGMKESSTVSVRGLRSILLLRIGIKLKRTPDFLAGYRRFCKFRPFFPIAFSHPFATFFFKLSPLSSE